MSLAPPSVGGLEHHWLYQKSSMFNKQPLEGPTVGVDTVYIHYIAPQEQVITCIFLKDGVFSI